VLKELLSIFSGKSALETVSQNFTEMLGITQEMILEASQIYWGKQQSPEERTRLYDRDVRVNKLERTIRKRIVSHLSIAVAPARDIPYCLVLMSVVKDVERLGDYAKNLLEAGELFREPLPDDDLVRELREIRRTVEATVAAASDIWTAEDRERALELTREGRGVSKRCDDLLHKLARAEYPTAVAVSLALGIRFYKRINGHVLNVLSSTIMPVHKLDYFDEDVIAR
jgi:phosphate uptake regulator